MTAAGATRVLRLLGDDRVTLTERRDPEPDPDQALVRVEASGLCGSERSALARGLSTGPANAGHEAAGVIEWVPGGSGFNVGDRVGIAALYGCGTCVPCRDGHEMRCTQGPSPQLGLHADRVIVSVSTLRRLPDGIDPAVAVLLSGDGLGVPVRGAHRVPAPPGTRVLVIGLGPVGLAHVLVRAHAGCEVIGIEPSCERRALALSLGASGAFPPGSDIGEPSDLVIESTGLAACVNQALDTVKAGGTVLQSGECTAVEIRPSAQIVHREVTYIGSWFYGRADYPAMLDLYRDGLPIDKLITHEFPAERAQEGVDVFLSAASGKVILRWA